MSKWIQIHKAGTSDSGKTNIYAVATTTGDILGRIAWHSGWRRYVFRPLPETLFDAGCMRTIVDFIEKEMGARQLHAQLQEEAQRE